MGLVDMSRMLLSGLLVCTFAVGSCTSSGAPRSEGMSSERAADPAASAPEVMATSGRPRVVFLGDSLTAGLGLDREDSVPALLQARLDREGYAYDVVNAGVSGDTSAGGLRRLEWSLAGDVRVLVVELGANDGLRGLSPRAMQENLTQVIETARGRGIKVLLTGMEAPPNYGPAYTSEFRQVYATVAALPGVTFMPFFLQDVAGDPALNQRDGIHPNPAGARIVERNVWRVLEPLLEARATR